MHDELVAAAKAHLEEQGCEVIVDTDDEKTFLMGVKTINKFQREIHEVWIWPPRVAEVGNSTITA